MIFAHVRQSDGLVTDIVLAADQAVANATLPQGHTAIPANGAGIGWTYDDGQFIAPPVEEPEPVPDVFAILQAQIDELTDLMLELI